MNAFQTKMAEAEKNINALRDSQLNELRATARQTALQARAVENAKFKDAFVDKALAHHIAQGHDPRVAADKAYTEWEQHEKLLNAAPIDVPEVTLPAESESLIVARVLGLDTNKMTTMPAVRPAEPTAKQIEQSRLSAGMRNAIVNGRLDITKYAEAVKTPEQSQQ